LLLSDITPVILTRNEASNIHRTLSQLAWAEDVVIVDSMSSDNTLEISRSFPQVRVFQREIDTLAGQWNYAITRTGIRTPWILALDADYFVPDEVVAELRNLQPEAVTMAYRARFKYCVCGKPLRRSLYPPVTMLFRKKYAEYRQDGHAHRVRIQGHIENLKNPVYHDDRKPLSVWIATQNRYMDLEAAKIASTPWFSLGWSGRIRKLRLVAPPLVFLYCLVVKGNLLDGWPGLYYASQRALAESILSLRLLHLDLERRFDEYRT